MAKNPTISQLDAAQVMKRVYDEANDCIRTELGVNSGIDIQLDAGTDTISTQGISSSTKVSLTNASSGVVVPAFSCVGMKSFQLYSSTTATITGSQVLTLEVSPSDTDNVWVATSVTVTPSTTNGITLMGTASTTIVGRRVRVSIAAALSTGTADIYVVVQGH